MNVVSVLIEESLGILGLVEFDAKRCSWEQNFIAITCISNVISVVMAAVTVAVLQLELLAWCLLRSLWLFPVCRCKILLSDTEELITFNDLFLLKVAKIFLANLLLFASLFFFLVSAGSGIALILEILVVERDPHHFALAVLMLHLTELFTEGVRFRHASARK